MKRGCRFLSLCLAVALLGNGLLWLAACGNSNTSTEVNTSSTPSATGGNDPATTAPSAGTDDPVPGEEYGDLPRTVAAEGMVLLVNKDNSLPLKKGAKVAIFGKGQVETVKGGTGSGNVKNAEVIHFLTGMEEKATEGKIALYTTLAELYKKMPNLPINPSIANKAVKNADNAVYIITRNAGEASDRSAGRGDYLLSNEEINTLKTIIAAGFKNITVVLNVGGVMDTTELLSFPEVRSVLLAWQPGGQGGRAIADLLVGDVTPSGKLADTFAKSYNDYPTTESFLESPDYVKYTEDIYVGYRWFETFDPHYEKVNFEFGFGLSYTTFAMSQPTVTAKANGLEVSVTVTNSGERYSGKEVVQLYYSAPQGKLGKPAKELGAFAKTKTLAPGESQTLTLFLPFADMASYDDTGKVQKSAWILEAGDYRLFLGNSVKNAGERGAFYTHTQKEMTVVQQLSQQMTAKLLEKRLLANGTYENIYNDEGIGLPLSKELTKIEAESFYGKHCHAEVRFNGDASVCGIKTLTSNEGDRYVTFALEVDTPGDYRVALGIGNAGSAQRDGVRFYVNNLLQPDALTLPATKGEFRIEEVGTATVHLEKGLNFLKVLFVCGDKFTGLLDYITIEYGKGSVETPLPGNTVAVSTAGVTTVQGEDYADASSDVGIEDISAGADRGGASVKNLHSAGYYVTYRLNVSEAGDYRIVMRVANGLDASHSPATCTVNGVRQNGFGYDMPKTATDNNQYFNFIDAPAGTLTLTKGINTVTFTVTERMGNLDYFTLEKVAVLPLEGNSANLSKGTIRWEDVCKDPSLLNAFILQLTDEQLVYLLHGHGENIPEGTGSIGGIADWGIPSAETSDGPAGINLSTRTTAWPVETLVACTWNTALVKAMGQKIGEEAIANRVDLWLAPGMNIHRNPLCGRNFEYYSEDPYVTGTIAAALTQGVQSMQVGVTVKHFACNEKETNRGYTDSRVSERALREIYLKAFEICIRAADPWAIMTTYNKVNGKETAENSALLREIVRGEWGYQGLIMTDWWNDSVEYKELIAGNNLKMKSGDEAGVLGALKQGIITRDLIRENVKWILEFVLRSRASQRITETAAIEVKNGTVIRSVDSTWKSGEIGMEACKDRDGGFNTTNTYEGQWLIFVIDVKEAGTYTVQLRVASENGSGAIDFLIDGRKTGSFRNTQRTGDWQSWVDSDGKVTLRLTEGTHQLRLNFTQGGFNINTITFTQK